MQFFSEDLEDEIEDEYDVNEIDMVKKMIGLNIDEADESAESHDQANMKNLFSKSNKIYDLKNPSSKVFLIFISSLMMNEFQ